MSRIPPEKTSVLVLCTGNSCRSQMAEAFLEKHGGERIVAHSAGSEPAERVHPLTVEVMEEVGIDLSGARPEHLSVYRGRIPVDVLITVCGGAEESCPVWPGAEERLFWPFDDPAAFEGTPGETREEFRRVRDEIEERIVAWLKSGSE